MYASAIVPTVLAEARSKEMALLLDQDPNPATWWATTLECSSAIHRRRHEDIISMMECAQKLASLNEILSVFWIVPATDSVLAMAARLLSDYRLRTGDALQLASALTGPMVSSR